MANSALRKALGAVKDQTSIGMAIVSGNTSPELDVAIVKATNHDDDPADTRHIREVIEIVSRSGGAGAAACVASIARRLGKTRDYVVAVKCLALVHRILAAGNPAFRYELVQDYRRGSRLLDLVGFHDEAHAGSWDFSTFVRTYALYLAKLLDSEPSPAALQSMPPDQLLGHVRLLQQRLDRLLPCRPTGAARFSRLVLSTLHAVVSDSFALYAELRGALAMLLDGILDVPYADAVAVVEVYRRAAEQIDELALFYDWAKNMGVVRVSEFPGVEHIGDMQLQTLEEIVVQRQSSGDSGSLPVKTVIAVPPPPPPALEETSATVLALPEKTEEAAAPEALHEYALPAPAPPQQVADLVDLRDSGITSDEQADRLALALFSGGPAASAMAGAWTPLSAEEAPAVTSAWQTPAAAAGAADWEVALVEGASQLANQKAALGGGFDPLLLNGMYDAGAVRQHVAVQASAGSASSVALPAAKPILALPAPDGTMSAVGGGDPFAASLTVPPPAYVQMAELERKQWLLAQEQQMWRRYQESGMQGPVDAGLFTVNPAVPQVGVPRAYTMAGGYYLPL